MSELEDFIKKYTKIDEDGIDMYFFKVSVIGNPSINEFLDLIKTCNKTVYEIDLFDYTHHSYLKLGDWIGRQSMALRFMALGSYFGIWNVRTPNDISINVSHATKLTLASMGHISIHCTREQREKVNKIIAEKKDKFKRKILDSIDSVLDARMENLPDTVLNAIIKCEFPRDNKSIIVVEFR